MAVHIELLTLQLKQRVVQEKTSPLMIVVQILDPLPLLRHTGLNTIPLPRVVNSEVDYRSTQRLTLVVSLSRRAHIRSVMAAA